MEKKRKPILMEYVWLGVALISFGFGVHATINVGFQKSYIFLVLVILAVLMYVWRRHIRKNVEKND